MHDQAALAYSRTAQATIGPRELEAQILRKAAAKLQAVQDGWNGSGAALQEALLYNRKLWTIFASAMAEVENPNPQTVKNNVANLAIFVLNRTLALQADPSPEGLDALININLQIAGGLSGQG